MPDDPTSVKARFNYITRISTKVVHPAHAKEVPAQALQDFAGEYTVVAAGRFYDANVYQQLLGIVHNWTEPELTTQHLMQLDELFAEASSD